MPSEEMRRRAFLRAAGLGTVGVAAGGVGILTSCVGGGGRVGS
ncbi:MAG: hypothetical protein JWM05_272, partial [Acidimicrobiales bacterium]|nr:hypothetical protein [Acidimicrobiales bacterium]